MRDNILMVYFALAAGLTLKTLAFDVSADGNRQLNGGVNLTADSNTETIQPTGVGSVANPFVYNWDNIDGAGTDASDSLVLGSSRIYMDVNTSGSTNSLTLRLKNANGKGNITGDSGVTAISTALTAGTNPEDSGRLIISNVNHIACGIIDSSRKQTSTSSPAGVGEGIVIGHPSDRAGNIRVDGLRTGYYLYSGARGSAGNLEVYSSGDVKIETSDGTAGDLISWSGGEDNGRITIHHNGSFRCAAILATAGCSYTSSGNARSVSLNGDILGDNPDGGCEILGSISNAQIRADYGDPNENMAIINYTNVSIGGDILTYHASAKYSDNHAGDIAITGITYNITISGTIDAHVTHTSAQKGDVRLYCGGSVTIGSGLNCSNLNFAAFNSGSAKSAILGELANFVSATPALRCPFGQVITYDPEVPGNTYLASLEYTLPDLGGTPDAGGKLVPALAERGTIVLFK